MDAKKTLKEVDLKFTSGNSIDVDRATFTREFYYDILRPLLEDGVRWRNCNRKIDLGGGEYIETHVNVGVNQWSDNGWEGYTEIKPEELEAIINAIEQENNDVRITT